MGSVVVVGRCAARKVKREFASFLSKFDTVVTNIAVKRRRKDFTQITLFGSLSLAVTLSYPAERRVTVSEPFPTPPFHVTSPLSLALS